MMQKSENQNFHCIYTLSISYILLVFTCLIVTYMMLQNLPTYINKENNCLKSYILIIVYIG